MLVGVSPAVSRPGMFFSFFDPGISVQWVVGDNQVSKICHDCVGGWAKQWLQGFWNRLGTSNHSEESTVI